jgi:hypothetical protein
VTVWHELHFRSAIHAVATFSMYGKLRRTAPRTASGVARAGRDDGCVGSGCGATDGAAGAGPTAQASIATPTAGMQDNVNRFIASSQKQTAPSRHPAAPKVYRRRGLG